MATRLYISTTEGPPVVPAAVSSLWEFSGDDRIDALLSTVTPANHVSFDATHPIPSNYSNTDVLLGQHVTGLLRAGQTISTLTVAAQLIGILSGTSALKLTLGVRIVSDDGVTIRKTLLIVKRDGSDLPQPTSRVNRTFSELATFSSYTTVAGDRLVVEVGLGGTWNNPTTAGLAFGSTTGADLPVDESTTTDARPWIELSQTLEFETEVSAAAWSTAWTFNDVALTVTGGSGSAEIPGGSAAGGFLMLDEEDLI